eukprot:2686267-Pyramimonas_sp.AAC.1
MGRSDTGAKRGDVLCVGGAFAEVYAHREQDVVHDWVGVYWDEKVLHLRVNLREAIPNTTSE